MLAHGLVAAGPVEARPSRPRVELRLRPEQRLAAAHARIDAGALLGIERRGAGTLGAVLPRDVVLLAGELRAPFGIRFDDLVGARRAWRRCALGHEDVAF